MIKITCVWFCLKLWLYQSTVQQKYPTTKPTKRPLVISSNQYIRICAWKMKKTTIFTYKNHNTLYNVVYVHNAASNRTSQDEWNRLTFFSCRWSIPNCNSVWYACTSWQLRALPWSTNVTQIQTTQSTCIWTHAVMCSNNFPLTYKISRHQKPRHCSIRVEERTTPILIDTGLCSLWPPKNGRHSHTQPFNGLYLDNLGSPVPEG